MHNLNLISSLQIDESVQIEAHEDPNYPNADRSVRLINMAYRAAERAGISITAEKVNNYTVTVTRIQVN